MLPCGKPIFILFLLAFVSGSIIAMRAAPRRRADLTLWTFADTHADSYRQLLPGFERQSHLSVDVKLVNVSAISLRLGAAFDRDNSDDSTLPDVVEIEIGTIGKFFRPPLADVGFLPLNYLFFTQDWRGRVIASRFAPWTKDGVVFGLPHDVHPVSLTYRKDLFDEAGIDLSSVATWAVLQERCLAFQQYWLTHGAPARRAIELASTASDSLSMMLQQRGINVLDDRNVVHIADPKVAETIAFYAQLVAGPKQIAADASPGTNIWINDFARGDLCVLLTADWRAGMLREAMHHQLAGKVAMIPLPRFDPSDAPTASWGGTMAAIPRRCRDPQAAWNLITYLYSSPKGVAARWQKTMILPADQTLWSDPAFHQPDAFFSQQRCGELYIDLAKQLPTRYVTPFTALADIELASVLSRTISRVRAGAASDELLIAEIQSQLGAAATELRERIRFGTFEDQSTLPVRGRGVRTIDDAELDDSPPRRALYFRGAVRRLFATFFLYPLSRSLILSVYKTAGPRRSIFVGLDNYRFLLRDRYFWLATANTIAFAVAFVVIQLPLSLGLAVLLDRPSLRARGLFRFAFFSTHLVGQVFVAVLFSQLLAPRGGMINSILSRLLARPIEINWLGDPRLAMLCVLAASLWLSVGFGMIYFLAALQSVDRELYDAAAVDGSGKLGKFWHVTLPGIRPVIVFLMLVGFIASLQLFELPWVLFQQSTGPNGSALTIAMYLFQAGFVVHDLGYASAIGWTMVVMTIAVGLLPLRATRFRRQAT